MTASLSYRCFDLKVDSFRVFQALKELPYCFLLDSSLKSPELGRFSFLGFDPFFVLRVKAQSPFGRLRQLLKKYQLRNSTSLSPFISGAVGFFAYDLGFLLERISSRAVDDLKLPDCFLGFYDTTLTLDHFKNKLYVFSTGFPETSSLLAKKRSSLRLKQVMGILSRANLEKESLPAAEKIKSSYVGRKETLIFKSNFSKPAYLKAAQKALDYIGSGDIYQVNLSQRFCADVLPRQARENSLGEDLFWNLRRFFPSPFSAFMDFGDFKIISSSPERFLRLRGKRVETRPMKGTRPRGESPKQDVEFKKGLLQSPKDKAELLMITDLERNDLGRACNYGSVRVKNMRCLEKYSTVFQTTSLIEGTLHKDKDAIDLLKGCFPGGSITGCPKIRSMEIIEELEPTKRSIYTGALGYLDFGGNMDLNILIRTLALKKNRVYFQVGGGIVADSQPESEYQETLVKARAMFEAVRYTADNLKVR